MTFEEANEKIKSDKSTERAEAFKAFGCTFNHNICFGCIRKDKCNRRDLSIRNCNFFDDYAELFRAEEKI